MKELEKKAKAQSTSNISDIKEQNTLKKDIASIKESLSGLGTSVAQDGEMRARVSKLKHSTAVLRDTVDELQGQLGARLRFDYKDPEKGFDRTRVKGMVGKLITVTKPTFATALEVAAGGKLYQVVVDNEETGKALLTKGQLKKRVTLLPLSKIDSRTMSADRVDAAKKVAEKYGGQAYLALELISFDKAVTKAMQHVFGSTIICSSSDVAKAVAFDKSVKAKTITPEGTCTIPQVP